MRSMGGRTQRRLRIFAVGLLGLGARLSVGESQETVRMSNAGARQPSEVSVAINPREPQNIVAVSMQRGAAGQPRASDYAYVSRDGGRHWRTVPGHNPERRVQGDDAVAFDGEGNAFWSYISFRGIRMDRPEDPVSGIFVVRSGDGGQSWGSPVAVVDHENTVEPFEDKPYLVADRAPDSPFRGNLYVAWTRFDVYGSAAPEDRSHIYFSRSDDQGASFAMPLRVSDEPGDALDGDGTVEGAVPAVGPNGEVYLVWAGPRGLLFDRSLDGGLTFGADRIIADNPGGWEIPIEGIQRANGLPVTGVDLSEGPQRGSLYVNWVDERFGDADVFVIHSRDGGETWSAPVRVNDDPLRNGKDQFFTWMAVDPHDGSVNVVFYDRRGLEGTTTRLTLARSIDGGQTFVNHVLAQDPFATTEDVFFGDYLGIDALGGRVVAAYTHFIGDEELAVSAALLRFEPGQQSLVR